MVNFSLQDFICSKSLAAEEEDAELGFSWLILISSFIWGMVPLISFSGKLLLIA